MVCVRHRGIFLFLYGMSLFIWDIQIQGNRYTRDTLMGFLESGGEGRQPKGAGGLRALEEEIRAAFRRSPGFPQAFPEPAFYPGKGK